MAELGSKLADLIQRLVVIIKQALAKKRVKGESNRLVESNVVIGDNKLSDTHNNLLSPPRPLSKNDLIKLRKEKFTTDYLEAQGRRVERNPLEHASGAGRQGDVLVDGFKTELKTINEGKVSTVVNSVNNSLRTKSGTTGQARSIVLDARNAKGGLTEQQAREALTEISKIQKAKDRLYSVEIIGENFFIRQSIKPSKYIIGVFI